MKKTNKIIAVILAMVLSLSSLPILASASAVKDDVKTVDQLIQPDSLGNLVEWLLKNINTRKEAITPTILRLVFLFIEEDSLVIDYLRGDVDSDDSVSAGDARLALRNSVGLEDFTEEQTKAADVDGDGVSSSDARLILRASVGLADIAGTVLQRKDVVKTEATQLADTLVNWLDVNLPAWTSEITGQSWWGIVEFLTPLLGVKLDLSNTRGLVESLASICKVAHNNLLLNLGDLEKLTNNHIKNVNKNSSSLDIIYALLSWLADDGTVQVLKQAVKGKLSLGNTIETFAKGTSDDINEMITDVISPAAIKELLCDAVELDYSKYQNYTADEIVAVAFLKLLTNNEDVSQQEASEVMNYTIYEFLETYAGDIYANLLLDLINNDAKDALKDLAAEDTTGKIAEVINLNYEFKADTFDAYLGAGKGNMIAQLNNLVITLLEVILTEDAFAAIALDEGGNDKLNENLTKTFRYILPLIKDVPGLGADLSGFTSAAVANMSAEEMAVAVLKLFFEGWFENADMAEVNKATTLEQLAVLAAKYAVTNDEWVPMEITAAAKAVSVEKIADDACLDLVFEIGMETAAKALNYNKKTTYYELPKDTSTWTGEAYLDDIADWALNFVDGLPAKADSLSTKRNEIDGNGGFYKLNVVLNSLIDLSFISGCGKDGFAVDLETMLMDMFLSNLLDFDIEASVAILAENEDSSIFNKKINEAAIDIVDDLLTGLFVK